MSEEPPPAIPDWMRTVARVGWDLLGVVFWVTVIYLIRCTSAPF